MTTISPMSRRALLGCAAVAALPVSAFAAAVARDESWAPALAILKQIKPPKFAKRDFDIRKFGADPADQAKTSAAIAAAIAACSSNTGGGRVVIPAGTWPTAAITLKSNVNLYLAKDATLKFSQTPADYPIVLTRFEGVECMNYSPFIYAFGETNLAITGEGTLDGQADETHWWDWTKGARDPKHGNAVAVLGKMADDNVPVDKRVFGGDWKLRPNFIQPYRCTDILIEGIKVVRSPMWEIHPVLSENITVRKVRIDSTGPNNDGCDPECCKNVLIENVTFNTGDDCIAIKSGRNADGRRINMPSENIVIQNCQMIGGHGGVSLGSEASGGIRNIYVRDCHMGSPNLNRALRIKSNSWRGGYVRDVVFRDIKVDQVANDIFQIDMNYGEGMGGAFDPKFSNVLFDNVICAKADRALDLRGYAGNEVTGITIRNCVFDNVTKPASIAFTEIKASNVRINGQLWSPPAPEKYTE